MQKDQSAPNKVYDSLASVKLTVFIFFALAVASLIGTLLPQGTPLEELQHHYSPWAASLISLLGLSDLYRTLWFQLLLLLLCVNLVTCTVQRLPKTVKLVQRREEQVSADKLSKFYYTRRLSARLSFSEAQVRLRKTIGDAFGPLRDLEGANAFCAVAEKGRWSRFMVYGVHVSILVVLVGALMGSLFGFKGFMNLPEGSASNEVMLASGNGSRILPFQVRCDDFDVSYYDTGAPKEFRSDLVIMENDKEVLKETIRVNDPLTYQGVTFYQASYGAMLKQAELELKDRDSGKTFNLTLPYGAMIPIPGTRDLIQVVEYKDKFMQFGAALGVELVRDGQHLPGMWILADKPEFHGNKIQNYQVRVLKIDQGYYTGLQVKQDPGVWVVWIGFTLMVIGIGLAFYSSHNKIWICAEPAKSGKDAVTITVAGRTSRSTAGFGEQFEEICNQLKNDLGSEAISSKESKK